MLRHAPLLSLLLVAAPASGQALVADVPHRGAQVYQRTTDRLEVTPRASTIRADWVLLGASGPGHEWRYTSCTRKDAPEGFERPGFADEAWQLGRAEFGSEPAMDGRRRTEWRTEHLCLRTTVDLGTKKPKALWFVVDHDDGLRIWLNGKQLVADDGYGRGRSFVVGSDALDAWQRGPNLLAASCNNIGGLQYFDLALGLVHALPAGVRTTDDLQRVLGEEREVATRAQSELFGAFRAPALLLQGDLDAAQQRVRIAPGDLRDLGWWLAMDLSTGSQGGTLQLDAGRLFRLGDLQVKGRASAVDRDGWQTLEATVRNTPEPAPREDSKRHVDRHVRPFVWYGFDGKLQVRRRIAVRDGKAMVLEYATELGGRLLRGKDWKEHAADLRHRETARHVAVRENQDAEFRSMVATALTRGTTKLREQLADLTAPTLAEQAQDAADSYHTGRLAIGILALVKGGVPVDDPVVQRGYAELRRRTLIDTYSLGNAIMAIEALYVPAAETGDLKAGTLDRPRRRTPSPEDKQLLQRWVDRLLQNVDTRVDAASVLRFNYTGGDRFDNSVNQYGLLGLHSAHLCGIEVPSTVWEAAIQHLLTAQCPEGAKVELDLVDFRTHTRRLADPSTTITTARSSQRACGWGYEEARDDGELTPTWGSMTCAGITGLAICQAALQEQPGQKRLKLQNDAARARRDGFAWLARHMTQRCHPGAIERQQRWFYYYLYGLERAALLSGVALIQDRDWYFEGAMVLVSTQQPDGQWPAELVWDEAIERNAMAILFLKQSTQPVLTGQ